MAGGLVALLDDVAVLAPLVLREVTYRVLAGPQGRDVRDWLHGRGFDDATIRANLLGCDPGRQLLARARRRGDLGAHRRSSGAGATSSSSWVACAVTWSRSPNRYWNSSITATIRAASGIASPARPFG